MVQVELSWSYRPHGHVIMEASEGYPSSHHLSYHWVALYHTLLLSIKLLLLCSCNSPNSLILLGCSLWHLRAMAWLARCLWS